MSREAFGSADTVYVATGSAFPDALVAAAAAGSLDGPVLLVTRTSIPGATRSELARLSPHRIVVVGGASAVANSVVAGLRSYADHVDRVWGGDRYATAAAVSSDAFGSPRRVYVATGANYPDALVAAAAAGKKSAPVLLVTWGGLPTKTRSELARLDPRSIFVVGGPGAVSDAVVAALRLYGGTVTRLAQSDRYGTAQALSRAAFKSAKTVYIATGANFPDALVAGAAAGSRDAPVLLVTRTHVPGATRDELTRLDPDRVVLVGGLSVVSDSVKRDLENIIGG